MRKKILFENKSLYYTFQKPKSKREELRKESQLTRTREKENWGDNQHLTDVSTTFLTVAKMSGKNSSTGEESQTQLQQSKQWEKKIGKHKPRAAIQTNGHTKIWIESQLDIERVMLIEFIHWLRLGATDYKY